MTIKNIYMCMILCIFGMSGVAFASGYWGLDDYFCQAVVINDSMKPVWIVTQDRGSVADLASFVKTNAADMLLPGERGRVIAPVYMYQDAVPPKNMKKYAFDIPFSAMDRIGILYEGNCYKVRKSGSTDIWLSVLQREHKKILKREELELQKDIAAIKEEEVKEAQL